MTAPTAVRSATRRLVGLTALRWLPVGLTTPITVLLAQARGLSPRPRSVCCSPCTASWSPAARAAHRRARRRARPPSGRRGGRGAAHRRPACSRDGDIVRRLPRRHRRCWVSAALWTPGRSRPGTSTPCTASTRRPTSRPAWPSTARPTAAASPSARSLGGFLPGLLGAPARRGSRCRTSAAAVLDVVFIVAVVRLLTEERPPREGSIARRARGRARARARHGHRRGAAVGHRRADAAGPAADRGRRRRAGGLRAARAGAVRRPRGRPGRRRGGLRRRPRGLLRGRGGRRDDDAGTAPAAARLHPRDLRGCCSPSAPSRWPWSPGPDVLLVAGAGFALYYLAHGSTWPLLSAVLHTRVDAAHRATAVSAMSLAMALGGIVGNLAVPRLAAALGTGAGFLGVAVVVLVGAVACLGLPRATTVGRRRTPTPRRSAWSDLRNARDTRSH